MKGIAIANELSKLIYDLIYLREGRKIESEVLEEKGILPNFERFERNTKYDFPNIKEIIEKFVSRKIKVDLKIRNEIELLEYYIQHEFKNSKLKEYSLKIKNMIDSHSVDIVTLEEMLEDNLFFAIYAVARPLNIMKYVSGSYFAPIDLIILSFPTIRDATCRAFYTKKIPPSRLEREERTLTKVILGEEITHFVGKSLILQDDYLKEQILLKYYELGKYAMGFLEKEAFENQLSRYLFYDLELADIRLPLYLPNTIVEKRKEEVLSLGELIKVHSHLARLSEGLAKFIAKAAILEKNPQFKDFYLVNVKTPEDTLVHSYIYFFESCYKQIGNSIFEKVNLFPPTSEEILQPSLYLQRVGK